jgi:hypothetical protein
VKEVRGTKRRFGGERSEGSYSQLPGNAGVELLSSFTPVARRQVSLLLLSSFTHTHVNARACAYRRTCERGWGKKKEVGAVVATVGRRWAPRESSTNRSSQRTAATRGHTWAHGACAKVAEALAAMGPPRRVTVGEARGNSRQGRHSLFLMSEVFPFGGLACPLR